jgi:hypothetical protein
MRQRERLRTKPKDPARHEVKMSTVARKAAASCLLHSHRTLHKVNLYGESSKRQCAFGGIAHAKGRGTA